MIKRKLYSALRAHLKKKEISLIVGPRQAGKTTLMGLLRNDLEKEKKKNMFLNLDIEQDRHFFVSQAKLVDKIKLEIGPNGYVFIDEIQRKEDAGVFLKGLYDMNLPYKFIVSGSGNLELKEKIHESLLGRKRIFQLFTLSFEEFVNFKTRYSYESKLQDFFQIESEKGLQLLDEYLQFGGYPRLVLEDTFSEKKAIINEIYQSYLEKDIAYLLNIKKTDDFSKLVKLMAGQIGSMLNIKEISSTLGIAQETVKNYLWYLQKTFILGKITPYFKNLRKEITKAPICYFYDTGFRNHALGMFGNLQDEKGFVFQNFVYRKLLEEIDEAESSAKICFWRTKNGAEVDFLVDLGGEQIPVEVKYRRFKEVEISASFRSYLDKYKPKRSVIVNLNFCKKIKINDCLVEFLPFYSKILKE